MLYLGGIIPTVIQPCMYGPLNPELVILKTMQRLAMHIKTVAIQFLNTPNIFIIAFFLTFTN